MSDCNWDYLGQQVLTLLRTKGKQKFELQSYPAKLKPLPVSSIFTGHYSALQKTSMYLLYRNQSISFESLILKIYFFFFFVVKNFLHYNHLPADTVFSCDYRACLLLTCVASLRPLCLTIT